MKENNITNGAAFILSEPSKVKLVHPLIGALREYADTVAKAAETLRDACDEALGTR
jgi:hypothetical protein